ncbi:arylsulfatase [Planctomycetota bacterium]
MHKEMKGTKMEPDNYTRREFLKTVGIGTAALAAAPEIILANSSSARSPNVVLVITDDQGYGDLACHGNPIIQTPNLDTLHAQSIRLTNFHVDPTCAPTRAALMTGRYSVRTGVWHTVMGRSFLRKDEVTMANVLAASGYSNAIFGKWALGGNYPFRPQDRGFHEVLITGDDGNLQVGDYWGNDRFDDTMFHNGKAEKFMGYSTDVLFDNAMKFIEAHKDEPFFVYLTTNAAHSPYNIPEKYSNLYRGKENVPNAKFYGTITKIDENVGRLRHKLEEMGLEDNTILIFMTDNGSAEGGFNAGMRSRKGSEYDGGHRVPFFIRWPAGCLKGGRDIDCLAAHIDVLPTLIELCRLNRPEAVEFDGMSLAPLLTGKWTSWPDRTVVVDSQRIEHPQKWRKNAIMTERWRLINGRELYDMKADPGQKNSVAELYPDVVVELRQAYEQWWSDVSARFDEYCEIIIGSEEGNTFPLTCHDWHTPISQIPWAEHHILDGLQGNGFWAVKIAREGIYEFSLRRWPAEVNKPINTAIPGGKAINASKARLEISDVDVTKPIDKDTVAVTFRVWLKAGKTRLQTWFIDDQGSSRGAYYVYVKRLS